VTRVLVCGGRRYDDAARVNEVLDHLAASQPVDVLIHGAARGADLLAVDWAIRHQIPLLEFGADWAAHGKAAGPIRNRRMLLEGKPDLVIAFPGGKGTENMVNQARKAGVQVEEIAP
jgi:hypothetical protein